MAALNGRICCIPLSVARWTDSLKNLCHLLNAPLQLFEDYCILRSHAVNCSMP